MSEPLRISWYKEEYLGVCGLADPPAGQSPAPLRHEALWHQTLRGCRHWKDSGVSSDRWRVMQRACSDHQCVPETKAHKLPRDIGDVRGPTHVGGNQSYALSELLAYRKMTTYFGLKIELWIFCLSLLGHRWWEREEVEPEKKEKTMEDYGKSWLIRWYTEYMKIE